MSAKDNNDETINEFKEKSQSAKTCVKLISFSNYFLICINQFQRSHEFVFDSIDKIHNKCKRITLNRGGRYIDSSDLIKTKKAPINPKNND